MNRDARKRAMGLLLLTGLTAVLFCHEAVAEAVVEFNDYALLIGVSRQQNAHDLRFPDRDATGLADALIAGGFPKDHVTIMTSDVGAALQPTQEKIREQLKRVAKLKCNTIVVMFSGHAFSPDGQDMLLMPSDASMDTASMLSMSEVLQALASCEARCKLLLIDAGAGWKKAIAPPEGVVVLLATNRGEMAHEFAKLKHGVFSHYVIQALRGAADYDHDGLITLPELELYTKHHVPRTARTEFQREQTPWRVGEVYGLPAIVRLPWRDSQISKSEPHSEDIKGRQTDNSMK